jgi:hypothetical protein
MRPLRLCKRCGGGGASLNYRLALQAFEEEP